MKRYLLSLAILAGGVVWIAMDAPTVVGPALLEPSPGGLEEPLAECGPDDPSCPQQIEAASRGSRPTPLPNDPLIQQVLLEDEAIETMIGSGRLGQDYWIDMFPLADPAHGDQGGTAEVYFAEPVSYEGEVTVASDPCKGHRENEVVAPDDPCRDQPRQLSTEHRTFTDARVIYALVDTERRQVLNMSEVNLPSEVIEERIRELAQGAGG